MTAVFGGLDRAGLELGPGLNLREAPNESGKSTGASFIRLMLYGLDTAKVAYIITSKTQEVTDILLHELDRGVTVLHGQGGWSGEERQVLMCAFKQKQIVAMKQYVKELDPDAFLIVCDAHEVLGQGFRRYQKNDL